MNRHGVSKFLYFLTEGVFCVSEDRAQDAKNTFANNFVFYLKKTGKNQSDVANYLGVTTSTVSDWANAKKYPRVDKMQALADYLGVLISDLRDEHSKDINERHVLSEEDKQIIELFRLIPEDKREYFLGMFEGILRSQGVL